MTTMHPQRRRTVFKSVSSFLFFVFNFSLFSLARVICVALGKTRAVCLFENEIIFIFLFTFVCLFVLLLRAYACECACRCMWPNGCWIDRNRTHTEIKPESIGRA